jgi:hypothetical protein
MDKQGNILTLKKQQENLKRSFVLNEYINECKWSYDWQNIELNFLITLQLCCFYNLWTWLEKILREMSILIYKHQLDKKTKLNFLWINIFNCYYRTFRINLLYTKLTYFFYFYFLYSTYQDMKKYYYEKWQPI